MSRHQAPASRETVPPESPSVVDLLGSRIRRARLDRGLGVRELARETDCSPSLISQIERNTTKPSVSTLYAISTALGTSVDSLLAGVPEVAEHAPLEPHLLAEGPYSRPRKPQVILRSSERRVISLEAGVQWQLLMPVPESSVEFMEVTYAPGGGSIAIDHAIRHSGREYCLVLEGILSVEIGRERYTLEPRDSMAFDSSVPHRIWNAGGVAVRAIWFVLDQLDG